MKNKNRIIISLIILLVCLVFNKVDYLRNNINSHTNFLNIASFYSNNLKYENLDLNEEKVYKNIISYKNYSVIENGFVIYNDIENVTSLSNGVVVNKTDKYLEILDSDGTLYVYRNLYSTNVMIYEYVLENQVIGVSSYNRNISSYYYVLYIKNGEFLSESEIFY